MLNYRLIKKHNAKLDEFIQLKLLYKVINQAEIL